MKVKFSAKKVQCHEGSSGGKYNNIIDIAYLIFSCALQLFYQYSWSTGNEIYRMIASYNTWGCR